MNMATIENVSGTIADLIEINNDRVAGFEKAIDDIEDENIDLKELFEGYAQQSRQNVEELISISGSAADVGNEKSVSGSLHRVWIDIKSLFGGSDRGSILSEAERGEDAIKKAYEDALSDEQLSYHIIEIIRGQAQGINAAHDRIRAMRDVSRD